MEKEIDLRPFLLAPLRRWKLIIGLVVLGIVLGIAFVVLQPRMSRASASLFIDPTIPQLTLDERFVNHDSTLVTNTGLQRQALVNLATSSTIEARVAERLKIQPYIPGSLLSRISVDATSDLVEITAYAASNAEASQLAEAWGRSYEELVAEVYSGVSASEERIDNELTQARQRYDTIQTELEQFYAEGRIVKVEQQVKGLEDLLDNSREAGSLLYSQYLTRTQQLDLILQDTVTLRDQVAAGSTNGLGDSLTALALRTRIASGNGDLPLPLQVAFSNAEGLARDGQATRTDLERLITVLEARRKALIAESQRLADSISEGNAPVIGMDGPTRAAYESKLGILKGELARLEGKQELLEKQRKVALGTVEALQARSDEQHIARTNPLVTVRFLNTTQLEPRSNVIRIGTAVTIGVTAGILLGLLLVIIIDFVIPGLNQLRNSAGSAPATEQTAEQPTATRYGD